MDDNRDMTTNTLHRSSVTDLHTGVTVSVGDIFRCSWGYEQTNIDFYQVTGITKSGMLRFRPVAQVLIEAKAGGCDMVSAIADEFIGETNFARRPRFYDSTCYVSIESYSSASPWNGEPTYQTASGWGH